MRKNIDIAPLESVILENTVTLCLSVYRDMEREVVAQFPSMVRDAFFAGREKALEITAEHVRPTGNSHVVIGFDFNKKTFGLSIEQVGSNDKPIVLTILAIIGAISILTIMCLTILASAGVIHLL